MAVFWRITCQQPGLLASRQEFQMFSAWDDRAAELAHMRDQGLRCMAEAEKRQDRQGYLLWQNCTSRIDLMLVAGQTREPMVRRST